MISKKESQQKPILKNYGKFNNIKLAKGVDLSTLCTIPRPEYDPYNVSVKSYGTKWFIVDNQKALFKTYDGYLKSIKNIRIINELICFNLAKKFGINCAEYKPAHINNDNGLITYNFIPPKQDLISLYNFFKLEPLHTPKNEDIKLGLKYRYTLKKNLYSISKCIDLYNKCGYKIDKKEVIFDIYKILVFDTLTMQCDRNIENLAFLYNKKKKTIHLAPMFDNEMAFCIQIFDEDFIGHKPDVNMSSEDFFNTFFGLSVNVAVLNSDYKQSNYESNVKYIAELAKANPEYMNFLKNAIDNFNIESTVKQLEKSGFDISKEYKEYLNKIATYSKNLILNELTKTTNIKKEITEITR